MSIRSARPLRRDGAEQQAPVMRKHFTARMLVTPSGRAAPQNHRWLTRQRVQRRIAPSDSVPMCCHANRLRAAEQEETRAIQAGSYASRDRNNWGALCARTIYDGIMNREVPKANRRIGIANCKEEPN